MTSNGHALSRDALIRTLTAYSGITTEDGAAGGGTLVDSNLIGRNDFISEKTILIMSGDAKDEDKGAIDFDNSDGKITLQGTGFSHQIKAGTIYRILNISSIEIDVANIKAQTDKIAGKMLFTLDMPWTTFTNQIVVSTGAGDKVLGSITIANIPADAVLVDARMMVKYNGRENTNAVANSISGAQNIQAQKAVAGAWLTGIALAGGEFATAGESGDILGDVVMGTANIVAQVPANDAVIEFKWTQALAAQDNLNFNGIQVGLRVVYSI